MTWRCSFHITGDASLGASHRSPSPAVRSDVASLGLSAERTVDGLTAMAHNRRSLPGRTAIRTKKGA